MADRLLVSTEQLDAASERYNQAKEEVFSALNGMRSAVRSVQGQWTGSAGNAFFTAFDTLYEVIRHSEELLEDAASELKAVSSIAQDTETHQQQTGSMLDSMSQSL